MVLFDKGHVVAACEGGSRRKGAMNKHRVDDREAGCLRDAARRLLAINSLHERGLGVIPNCLQDVENVLALGVPIGNRIGSVALSLEVYHKALLSVGAGAPGREQSATYLGRRVDAR